MKKHIYIIMYIAAFLLSGSCSTTSHLPEGETLYTGIGTISYVDQELKDKHKKRQRDGGVIVAIADATEQVMDVLKGNTPSAQPEQETPEAGSPLAKLSAAELSAEQKALEPVEEELDVVLAYPPNNSFFGSSTVRTPLPIGLWAYNAWGDKQKGLGHWLYRKIGSTPVLISSVSPDTRVKVAENVLRNYGFFRGHVDYSITPHKHNGRKAKINYYIHTDRVYRIDTVEYIGFPDYADSLILHTREQSYLHRDTPFSALTLQQEQNRIANLLRNRGYYYYKPSFATYKADTVAVQGRVQLRMQSSPTLPAMATKQWYIGQTHLTVLRNLGDTAQHSVQTRRGNFSYSGHKPPLHPYAVLRNVLHRRGELYRYWGQEKTGELLNELGIFSQLNLRYTPRDTTAAGDTLDLYITGILEPRYNADFEINVTERNSDRIGPGLSLGLKKKNAFRSAELLAFKLYGSYEWTTNLERDKQYGLLNSYEIGTKVSLDIPRMILPGTPPQRLRFPATTSVSVYADLLNRAGYFRMLSFGTSLSYSWRKSRTSRHELTPLSLTYYKLNRTTAQFDSLLSESPALAVSMQERFVPAIQYTYAYTSPRDTRHPIAWQLSIKEAGGLTSAVYALGGHDFSEKNKKLMNNPFTQFIKITSEFHHNWRVNTNTRLVLRAMGGVAWAYGNSEVVPYSDQFYSGGANSIRAFPIRRVGPGRFVSRGGRYSYLDQTGDLKIEGNIELRFPLLGALHGATFVDAGNIWLLRSDPNREGGTFSLSNLSNDIALGTGAGLRYDLDFLVLRADLGFALHDPASTRKGYLSADRFSNRFAFHFAIGYPF